MRRLFDLPGPTTREMSHVDDAGAPVYLVSGLPRSGTSMLMRMLEAGGLAVLTDGVRAADGDNPRGYYELGAIKATVVDASWVRVARGKAVKVISYLLPHLPGDVDYRVLFLRRDLHQVVRSQRAMLERLGQPVGESDEAARRLLAEHLVDVEAWLETAAHVRRLGVSHAGVLSDPRGQSERIARFFGRDLDLDAMARVVEPSLWRQR